MTPPKIAVYFAGRIQGYEECLEQLLQIKNDYNPIFFMSLNMDSNEVESTYIKNFKDIFSIQPECLEAEKTILPDFLDDKNFTSSQEFIGWDNESKCTKFLGDKFKNKKTPFWKFVNTNIYKTYSMYYHNKKAMDLILKYQKENTIQFDVVLKFRADIKYIQPLHLYLPLKNTLYIPEDWDYEEGINGNFAYGDLDSMIKYSYMIQNLESIISNNYMFHPEQMLKIYLDTACKMNIIRFPFITEFSDKRHMSI